MQSVAQARHLEKVSRSFPSGESEGNPLAFFGVVEGKMRSIEEKENESRLSSQAAAADRAFGRSDWASAEKLYMKAIESEPRDFRSRFLKGCVLFETKRFQEAAEEFAFIAANKPRTHAARFLEVLSRRRIESPDTPVLTLALEVYKTFEPKPDLDHPDWGDPIVQILLAQASEKSGPMVLDREGLAKVIAKHSEDVELLVGAALLQESSLQVSSLRNAFHLHPESPLAAAALLEKIASRRLEDELEEQLRLAEKLHTLDPENSLGLYLLAYYRNYVPPGKGDGFWKTLTLRDSEWELIRQASRLTKFDNYRTRCDGVELRLLRMLNHPFDFPLGFGNRGVLIPLLNLASDRLRATAEEAFESGNTDLGFAVCDAIELLGRRLQESRGPILYHHSAETILGIARELREKYYRKSGDVAKADALKNEAEDVKVHDISAEPLNILTFSVLPVPVLQNALLSALREDGVGFVKMLE